MSERWEIASEFVRRVIVFDPDDGLYTSHFTNLTTNTDLIAKARAEQRWTPEFDFRINGERVTSLGQSWILLKASLTYLRQDLASQLVMQLRHTVLPVEIYIGYDCAAHATTKSYAIKNTGDQAIIISHVAIESLPVEIGSPGELQLDAHYGALPRETFLTGRVDDCAVVYRNPRSGDSVIALNEAPGHLKRIETGAWFWDGFVRIMYDTDLFPLEVHLQPDETWASASARLVLAANGRDYADPRWAMPAAITARRPRPAYWHYNTWDPFGPHIDEATVRELIPLAAQMGFEVFTIDDGWQAQYGANAAHPDRFPDGLDDIRAAVEAEGLRLGLWAPLAVVDPALANSDPELCCRDARGDIKTTLTAQGEQVVMCLASAYAERAAARLIELIERYQLAYLKLDLTTVFNAYGEAPGCYASGHQHATAAESVLRIYEAIGQVTQAIYVQHPEVLIDLTFELWGQKHTIDYGLLQAADLSWISNVGDNSASAAGPRQVRTLLYQRSLAIPVETMLIGNLRVETGDRREKFATALGSCPLLLGDLRRLTDEQIAWYGQQIRWYQRLHREVNISESFFPLGSWRQPSVMEWDGFARLSRSGEGLIVLFRNESNAMQARLQIPLLGKGSYTLTSILNRTVFQRSAENFRTGFDMAFDEGVMIVEVRLS